MSTEHLPADANPDANGAAVGHPSRSDSAKAGDFAHRALAALGALPSRIDKQIKAHPHAGLAAACVVGVAVGIVLSSRIVRSVLMSVATVATVEVARALLRQNLQTGDVR